MLRESDARSLAIRITSAVIWFALGWLLCLLPAWVQRAETFWIWNAAGAAVMAYSYVVQSHWHMSKQARLMLLICPVALCLALTEDFSLFYPDAVLMLCGESVGWNALLLHAQFYPVTTVTMLVLAIFMRPGGQSQAIALRWRVIEALVGIVIMMVAMESSITLLRALSRLAHWPWVSNGVVCAMLVGMNLFHLITPALHRILSFFKVAVVPA